ncbi:hypothetical protein [Amycolatopsis sp. lyj-23]|uniref:hypothetical protein n=1 Tax=Amycolatopsis sp. lyj-23 TaxID=2789283 RepID=UPI00397E263D
MSTMTTNPAETAAPTRPAYRVTWRHVLRSEWTKLWSLRSTWITLSLGLVFLVGFGLISAARYQSNVTSGQPLDPDFAQATAVSLSLFGPTSLSWPWASSGSWSPPASTRPG